MNKGGMVSHGLVTMWLLTKISNPYPGTGTQVQCCVAIVIPTVFHPRLDIQDPYPYPYPCYPYPWSRTRTHTHIYGLVPIPVPVLMTLSHVVPVPIPVPMVSYPYLYPYPWFRTRTRTHTRGLICIPVPVPMIRTHTTSLQFCPRLYHGPECSGYFKWFLVCYFLTRWSIFVKISQIVEIDVFYLVISLFYIAITFSTKFSWF